MIKGRRVAEQGRILRPGGFVVLGRVGMDLYADPPGTRVQDAAGFRAAIGGSAGNIAAALARQGAGVRLLTRLPPDAVGQYCRAELARYGVDCALIGEAPSGARASLAVTETTASATQVVLYRNGAADFTLTKDDVAAADFTGCAALIVTGTALAVEPSRGACWAALNAARAAGAQVVLDVDYRAPTWASAGEASEVCAAFARACDIVIGNDEEFALMAGGEAQGLALARALGATARLAVYKRGAAGSHAFTPAGSTQTGIYKVTALKPMGAGDGFMGGLMAGLAQGLPLEQALRRGAASAAIIVAGIGCAPASPTSAELDAFMATHTETPCT